MIEMIHRFNDIQKINEHSKLAVVNIVKPHNIKNNKKLKRPQTK